MRQKKQKDVAKENEFYMQLLQQALPVEPPNCVTTQAEPSAITDKTVNVKPTPPVKHSERNGIANGVVANGTPAIAQKPHRKSVEKSKEPHPDVEKQKPAHHHSNGSVVGVTLVEEPVVENDSKAQTTNRRKEKHRETVDREAKEQAEYIQRLETDCKRLRTDLQNSRSSEQELRAQVIANG